MSTASFSVPQLDQYRQQFPALSTKAYFNYGGQGPMTSSAISAIHSAHVHLQTIGPFSSAANSWIGNEARQMRAAIAAELGTSAEAIALTENVSAGCDIALWGLNWQTGDHLLLSDCEHPSVIATAQEIQRRFHIEISVFPLRETLNQGDPIANLAQHLRSTTRCVVLSHILWNTGQVLPLKDMIDVCHRHPTRSEPIRVLVDAAQSVGVLPLNLDELPVDFYAFTGHKWWCGPAGLGGLYVRPAVMETHHPTFVGWRGITKNAQGHPTGWESDARRYEVATSDYTLFAGLQEAIALHQQWGTAHDRYQRILELSQRLWQGLAQIPGITCLRTAPPEAGLVSFQLSKPGNMAHGEFVRSLEKQGFLLRTILDPDCVRACVHYFTSEAEIDQLIQAIQQMLI